MGNAWTRCAWGALFLLCLCACEPEQMQEAEEIIETTSQAPTPTENDSSSKQVRHPRTITLHQLGEAGSHRVTLGIPFPPGMLEDPEQLRVLDAAGRAVPIHVTPTLKWHFKTPPHNTLRAVRVQFQATLGPDQQRLTGWSFDLNGRDTTRDLTPVPVEDTLMEHPDPRKAGTRHPRVLAVLSPQWLSESGITTPFSPMRSDNHKLFWASQKRWAFDLDYTQSQLANWLFDRPTALYKGCMRTGNPACYREAYTSLRFWARQIKRTGEAGGTECRGGPTLGSAYKTCDGKYIYLENLKLHWALTGDDSLFDAALVRDMATTSWESWQAIPVRDGHHQPDDFFTERGAGLTLLAQVSAFEILGDTVLLERIQRSLDNLHAMQTNPVDGYPPEGGWRHSWDAHEGAENFPEGALDDRRFSPWMSENVVDALWHTHFVVRDPRIGEMISRAARALEKWGFTDSRGYIDKFGMDLVSYREKLEGYRGWNHGCNEGPQVMYSASSLASAEQLLKTNVNDGYYSDMHNPEAVLILALGYYFETDEQYRHQYLSRIADIERHFFNADCGSVDATVRLFNWQNRSNPWGTWLWARDNT